ncbi:MAG: amidase family protein, partial [Pseudomonas fluorescens]
EGLTEQMLLRNGAGLNWRGLYSTSFIDFHANWRQRADEFSDSVKSCLLTGQYMLERYRGRYYAKAQNLSRRLRDEYDAALSRVDVLVMPTTPMRATPLPTRDAPRSERVARAFEMIGNTAPFNATGHPAISVPCGFHDGLPIGLQIIGKHHDEVTLYKVAYAHQCASDWRRIGKDEKK